MNVFMLFAGSGPLVVLTSHVAIEDPDLLEKLAAKGLDKFVAYGIPVALAKARYGGHFDIVARSLQETDDLRVLDFDGARAFRLFKFKEMSGPFIYEPAMPPRVGSLAGAWGAVKMLPRWGSCRRRRLRGLVRLWASAPSVSPFHGDPPPPDRAARWGRIADFTPRSRASGPSRPGARRGSGRRTSGPFSGWLP